MLTKKIDLDSSVISSVNRVNSDPPDQDHMDSDDVNFTKSDSSLSKFKNSDILKDLDQKFLMLVQTRDLN